MDPAANERAADLAGLLNQSFGQWAVEARAEPSGDGGAIVRREGHRVKVARLAGPQLAFHAAAP